MKTRRRTGLAPVLGLAIRLDAASDTALEGDKPAIPEVKWIHVADEGEYRGYTRIPGGFTFTRATFESIQKNLRAHPQFSKGADGWGQSKVVRFDYEHVSVMDPTLGEIPQKGLPSPAWAMDVDIRTGADGKAQLWAKTWLGEQIRNQIAAGEYQWVSVVVAPSYTHPVTGEDIGPTLTSVAFTNDPFLQTLTPIAASRGIAARYFYDSATDAEDALGMLRSLFGLSLTATTSDVQAELAKLQGMLASGDPPVGIDLDELIGDIRTILNLPALSTAQEAIEEALKVTAAAGGEPIDDKPAAPAAQENTMDLVKVLGKRLALSEPTPEAILLAVADLQQTAEASEAEVKAADEAAAKLKAILEAMGVPDADAAVAKIAEDIRKAKELEALLPEIEALRAYKATEEEKAITQDVEEALAANRLGAGMRNALVMLRKSNPEQFAKDFPKVAPHEVHLNRPHAALPGGTQVQHPAANPAPVALGTSPGGALDLRHFSGRNGTERILSYLKSQDASLGKLPLEEQLKAAAQFRRANPHVIAG